MISRFLDCKSRKEYNVEGYLHFCEPWWAAKLSICRGHGPRKKVVGFPAYRLRTDAGVQRDNLVQLLLNKCQVESQHSQIFTDYLRLHGLVGELNFTNMTHLLEQFGASSHENELIKESIFLQLRKGPGHFVLISEGMEAFFQYMPQLLPKQFKKILENEAKLIPDLQKTLLTDPWTFGFGKILSYKHHLFGCEAQLQNFYNCGLINNFPAPLRDALHIYDVLKSLSRRLGHTYTMQTWLPKSKFFKEYQVRHWVDALEFLEGSNVIVREDKESKDGPKIYLTQLWNAENGIAKGIQKLFEQHKLDPWTFEMDFTSARFENLTKDIDQMNAALLISQKPVVVLSGKGGCGKTTVVSSVFQYAEELLRSKGQMFPDDDIDDFTLTQTASRLEQELQQNHILESNVLAEGEDLSEISHDTSNANSQLTVNESCLLDMRTESEMAKETNGDSSPTILLTAPTGKAANHLGRKSKLPSFTLHQVIFSYWHWKRGGSSVKGKFIPAPEEWKFSNVQALVVDECSLVSVSTFHTMFSALLDGADLKKVVLLGDVHQLPSIEPGYFLGDIYQALEGLGCSAMLTHNHRSESDLIIHNASLIAQQLVPVIDPARHFHQLNLEELGCGIDPNSSLDDLGIVQDDAIRALLKSNNPLLNDPKQSQFVAFRRRDCDAINEICCQHYCKHPTKCHKRKTRFEIGNKVCCSKNATVKNELVGEDIRLCNGEIFFIKDDRTISDNRNKKTRYLTLEYDDGSLIEVNYRNLKYSCRLKHAWARTIHTYQGSESNAVVYVVGSPGGQTWQHVYTAVTRGKKQVVMVTRRSHLEAAINNPPLKRRTSLRQKVEEQFANKLNRDLSSKTPIKGSQNGIPENTPSKTKPHLLRASGSDIPQPLGRQTTKSDLSENKPPGAVASCSNSLHKTGHAVQRSKPSIWSYSASSDQTVANYPGSAQEEAEEKEEHEEENSQTFSDWGDDVVADITQLESDASSMGAGGSGEKKKCETMISVSEAAAKERLKVLQSVGLNQTGAESAATDVFDDLIKSATRHKPPSRTKVRVGSPQKQKEYRRKLFDEDNQEIEDILYDLVPAVSKPKTASQKGNTGHMEGSKSNGVSLNKSVPNSHTQHPCNSSQQSSSPKRASAHDDYPLPVKRRQDFLPITNSDVSPLRRELLQIDLQ